MSVKMKFNASDMMDVDVAIIGGGVSGIYSAWRLTVDGQHASSRTPNVKVFEFGNRVGGRLETILFSEAAERRAEVGGMRFIPSWQKHISKLLEQLNLHNDIIDFPMGDAHNLFFLRGESFRGQSFLYGTTPYRLRGSEQGLSPDELFVAILNSLLMPVEQKIEPVRDASGKVVGYRGPSREEWDAFKKNPDFSFEGQPLVEQGFWNVLDRMLSPEAYKLLTDAGGYYTLTANWNAAEAAAFIGLDFVGAEYKTLAKGYDSFVETMADAFTRAGGEIWGNSELVKLDMDEQTGKLKLHFRNREPNATRKTFEVFANKVILAMPRHGLERLELHGTRFDLDADTNTQQRQLLGSVMEMPAFKLFMVFKEAWWNRLSLTSGRSVSDLPIRQTYYFGTDSKDGHSLLMTSYNDAEAVSFWKGLRRERVTKPRYISRNTVAEENRSPDTYEAPREMIRRATSQLRDLHGIEVPEPIASCYKDWSEEPFGAGWFLWKAGEKTWELMPKARRPWSKENVFVCGDCYSSLQGWVEGALNTAELMLQEHFGMERPSWLKGVYLGF